MKQPINTSQEATEVCFAASKLLPFQPDWPWLRDLCASLTVDGALPSAEALAQAYLERSTPKL